MQKRLGTETHSGEGVMKEDKLKDSRKPSQACQWGTLESQRASKQDKKKKSQNMHLTATTSGEVAQTLLFTSREWGLVKEVWASLLVLRVRTGLNALRTI